MRHSECADRYRAERAGAHRCAACQKISPIALLHRFTSLVTRMWHAQLARDSRAGLSVRPQATAACSPLKNASSSALIRSLCVEHMPCGAFEITLKDAPLTILAESKAESAIGTI